MGETGLPEPLNEAIMAVTGKGGNGNGNGRALTLPLLIGVFTVFIGGFWFITQQVFEVKSDLKIFQGELDQKTSDRFTGKDFGREKEIIELKMASVAEDVNENKVLLLSLQSQNKEILEALSDLENSIRDLEKDSRTNGVQD